MPGRAGWRRRREFDIASQEHPPGMPGSARRQGPARLPSRRSAHTSLKRPKKDRLMTKEELTGWALANGWRMIAGHPSLTKPSAPKEPIVRLVLPPTVANLNARKPAGKGERL